MSIDQPSGRSPEPVNPPRKTQPGGFGDDVIDTTIFVSSATADQPDEFFDQEQLTGAVLDQGTADTSPSVDEVEDEGTGEDYEDFASYLDQPEDDEAEIPRRPHHVTTVLIAHDGSRWRHRFRRG